MDAVELIKQERERQVAVEQWSPEHDDQHTEGELALMGAAYALTGYQAADLCTDVVGEVFCYFGDSDWFKPQEPIRDLVRAGALIAAEIDRRLRLNAMLESAKSA